jgi:ribosomal protein S18 acetylase RimI-like enzyme
MNAEADFRIRRVTTGDVAALTELAASTFVHTFGHLYPPEDLADYLATALSPAAQERVIRDPQVAAWFASAPDGVPVAFAVAGTCKLPVPGLEPRAGEIRNLYVRASHQQHGLGTKLLTVALGWLAEQGLAPLYVGVWSGNVGAQRLYGRFGFAKIGEYEFPVGRTRDREFILRRDHA